MWLFFMTVNIMNYVCVHTLDYIHTLFMVVWLIVLNIDLCIYFFDCTAEIHDLNGDNNWITKLRLICQEKPQNHETDHVSEATLLSKTLILDGTTRNFPHLCNVIYTHDDSSSNFWSFLCSLLQYCLIIYAITCRSAFCCLLSSFWIHLRPHLQAI